MDTSYLTTQVSTIIGQLHGLFDEIGVPKHERESRESEVEWSSLTLERPTDRGAAIYSSVGDTSQSIASSHRVSLGQ